MIDLQSFRQASKQKIQKYLRSLATQIMPRRGDHPDAGKFLYYPLPVKRIYDGVKPDYGESQKDYIERCTKIVKAAEKANAERSALRAVVTARAGCGKTFFAAKLCHALLFSQEDFFLSCSELIDGKTNYVPLMIQFSGIDSEALEGDIVDVFFRTCVSFPKNSSFPREELKELWKSQCDSGSALLIIDGFDELKKDETVSFMNRLQGFLNDYPLTNLIITSRSLIKDNSFTPYMILPMITQNLLEHSGKMWFESYYDDSSEYAKTAVEIINREIRKRNIVYFSVPEHFNYRLSCITADMPEHTYEFERGAVELAMNRYAARRNTLLCVNDARLLLGYLAGAVCIDKIKAFSREELAAVISNAYGDLCGSFSANPEPENVITDFIDNSFIAVQDESYSLNFPESIVHYICADAIVNELAPESVCHDYESFLCQNRYPLHDVAACVAHLDPRFGAKLFDCFLEDTCETDSVPFILRNYSTMMILCCKDHRVSERSLVRFCENEYKHNHYVHAVAVSNILNVSPSSQIVPIIKRLFLDSAEQGNTDYSFAYAACLAGGEKAVGKCDMIKKIDTLFAEKKDTAALALLMLASGEKLNYSEEEYNEKYFDGYPLSTLSPDSAERLNTMITQDFQHRPLLTKAVKAALAAGIVKRGDFAVSGDELAHILEDGRDELCEVLLAYTDVITQPVKTVCSENTAKRYHSLREEYGSENALINYWFFKISAALGSIASDAVYMASQEFSKQIHDSEANDYIKYTSLFVSDITSNQNPKDKAAQLKTVEMSSDAAALLQRDVVAQAVILNKVYVVAYPFSHRGDRFFRQLSDRSAVEEDAARFILCKEVLALALRRGVITALSELRLPDFVSSPSMLLRTAPSFDIVSVTPEQLLTEGVSMKIPRFIVNLVLCDLMKEHTPLELLQDEKALSRGYEISKSINKTILSSTALTCTGLFFAPFITSASPNR